MGEIKVTCATCGEHVLLANAQPEERGDWSWSCACTRRSTGVYDAKSTEIKEDKLEVSRSHDEVSKDIFNEIYRVVQKLESHLGRAKKVDTIELCRRMRIDSDSIDIAEVTICYTDYNHRLMPHHAGSAGCYRSNDDSDYRTNKWVVVCPSELAFIDSLDVAFQNAKMLWEGRDGEDNLAAD